MTTRISAGAGTVDITYGHTTFVADQDGVFTVPSDVASALVNQRTAAYAPDAAPVLTPPPSNMYNASAFEGVTLDLSTVASRLLLIELESYARMFPRDSAHFVDSAGEKHELTAAEISQVVAAARKKQFAAA